MTDQPAFKTRAEVDAWMDACRNLEKKRAAARALARRDRRLGRNTK